MSKHRVIGGVIVTTPEGVFANYRPDHRRISKAAWKRVQAVAVEACRAADYGSVASALQCMSAVTYFLAWCDRQGLRLDLETAFVPHHIERYCFAELRDLASETRATRRGYLRRVGRACTRKAGWPPPPRPYAANITLLRPYRPDEIAALLTAARTQNNPNHQWVATVMLALGLGAGLKPGEMLLVSAADVKPAPWDDDLTIISVAGRSVPVREEYLSVVQTVCRLRPEGALIGDFNPTAKDPLGALRAGIRWPE